MRPGGFAIACRLRKRGVGGVARPLHVTSLRVHTRCLRWCRCRGRVRAQGARCSWDRALEAKLALAARCVSLHAESPDRLPRIIERVQKKVNIAFGYLGEAE